MIRRPPRSTLFPYTTALPIWTIRCHPANEQPPPQLIGVETKPRPPGSRLAPGRDQVAEDRRQPVDGHEHVARRLIADRKSTRLNSSHSQISYAVFCLKNKKVPFSAPKRLISPQPTIILETTAVTLALPSPPVPSKLSLSGSSLPPRACSPTPGAPRRS